MLTAWVRIQFFFLLIYVELIMDYLNKNNSVSNTGRSTTFKNNITKPGRGKK